jgi:hypothetical protein
VEADDETLDDRIAFQAGTQVLDTANPGISLFGDSSDDRGEWCVGKPVWTSRCECTATLVLGDVKLGGDVVVALAKAGTPVAVVNDSMETCFAAMRSMPNAQSAALIAGLALVIDLRCTECATRVLDCLLECFPQVRTVVFLVETSVAAALAEREAKALALATALAGYWRRGSRPSHIIFVTGPDNTPCMRRLPVVERLRRLSRRASQALVTIPGAECIRLSFVGPYVPSCHGGSPVSESEGADLSGTRVLRFADEGMFRGLARAVAFLAAPSAFHAPENIVLVES